MTLRFTKMHGLGNDFMVLDLIRQDSELPTESIKAWANRHTGVGFDQLLVLEPPTDPSCDFLYRIYNADGGEVEHCGNGARCISRYVIDQGLSAKTHLRFEMQQGIMETRVLDDDLVEVNMGAPIISPEQIPFDAEQSAALYPLTVGDETLQIAAVSMGNPHAVLQIPDALKAPISELGPLIEHHPRFPNRVNAGFMQVMDRQNIRLRVFERGVGETEACGTGACAAVVAGIRQNLLDDRVCVELIGGTLIIEWQGGQSDVIMTGPTTTVYEGQIDL